MYVPVHVNVVVLVWLRPDYVSRNMGKLGDDHQPVPRYKVSQQHKGHLMESM